MGVRAEVEGDDFVVAITGAFDRFVCLSRGLRVPLAEVRGARVASWDEVRSELGWRTAGSYWPGRIATGWYAVPGRKGARQFLAVFRDRSSLLVVDTTRERPARVVIATDRAAELAAAIG